MAPHLFGNVPGVVCAFCDDVGQEDTISDRGPPSRCPTVMKPFLQELVVGFQDALPDRGSLRKLLDNECSASMLPWASTNSGSRMYCEIAAAIWCGWLWLDQNAVDSIRRLHPQSRKCSSR